MKIERALEGEFWRVEELAPSIHAETRYADTPLDVDKLKLWYDSQFNYDGVVVFFALEDNKTVGIGAFMCHPHYWCDVMIASDLMVYVIPERRGSTAAYRLIKAYEKWAVEFGASEITLGISSGINVERTSKFYQTLGFECEAVMFKKERANVFSKPSKPTAPSSSSTTSSSRADSSS